MRYSVTFSIKIKLMKPFPTAKWMIFLSKNALYGAVLREDCVYATCATDMPDMLHTL
jgi:hypothetical protein